MAKGYLTDLATVCREAGLKVVEVKGWKTRGHGKFRGTKTVVCHHTAGPSKGNMPSLNVIAFGRAGLAGPLCNLGLGRDGTVYIVAAGYGYHAGVVRSQSYANDYAIGIEAEATGLTTWPEVQMDAYALLCKALCDHYGIGVDRVLGHKEVCSPVGRKTDPNFSMDALRTSVRHIAAIRAERAKELIEEMTSPKNWDAEDKKAFREIFVNMSITADGHGVGFILRKLATSLGVK